MINREQSEVVPSSTIDQKPACDVMLLLQYSASLNIHLFIHFNRKCGLCLFKDILLDRNSILASEIQCYVSNMLSTTKMLVKDPDTKNTFLFYIFMHKHIKAIC